MMYSVRVIPRLFFLCIGLFLLVLTVYAWRVIALPEAKAEPKTAVAHSISGDTAVPPNCRNGALLRGPSQSAYLEMVHAGWTANFTVTFSPLVPEGIEYVPMVRLKQAFDPDTGQRLPEYYLQTQPLHDGPGGLGPIVVANPGYLWLVGNEVDRVFWQDDLMPDIYAEAYHDVYHFIKERDPSAQIAISGLVEVTPGRMQYLDLVWDSYIEKYHVPMPVDVWNMHIYILPEIRADGSHSRAAVALGTDPNLAILESDLTPNQCGQADVYCYAEHDDVSIFIQQVVWMREWMKAHGQQNKPLVITEYSLLYPVHYPDGSPFFDEFGNQFLPERVSAFMLATFDYLETAVDPDLGYPLDNNKLVQQWLWYAINDESPGTPNNLLNEDYSDLTLMGQTYRDHVAAQPVAINLLPDQIAHPVVQTMTMTGTISATISVSIRNNGNIATTAPFTVTFRDAANQVISAIAVTGEVGGCARREVAVSTVWSGLTEGANFYSATIDSEGDIVESNEGDNVAEGYVLVQPQQGFLPVINR